MCASSTPVSHHPGDGLPKFTTRHVTRHRLGMKAHFARQVQKLRQSYWYFVHPAAFEFCTETPETGCMIPTGRSLRIIGDVHGDAKAFAIAADTGHFVIQLGDLVDEGPDTVGALEIMFKMIEEHRGLFVLGNHDYKLVRALRGDSVTKPPYLARTISELSESLAAHTQLEVMRAPAWIKYGNLFFVHGGFHPAMLFEPPPPFPSGRPNPLLARAIYGQTNGRVTGAGRPERLLGWVDDIPENMTVYCGHDRRSQDGRPYIKTGAKGGKAVFLDTGAGKGGHLSWIDIPALSDP